MATKIDTVTAREKLKIRREPYWARLSKGAALGYRKMTAGPGGSWVLRVLDEEKQKQKYHSLGNFSEYADHLRFDEAKKAAEALLVHIGRGGTDEEVTVSQACKRFVEEARRLGRAKGALDLEGRYKRWIDSDSKFAKTPLKKLTVAMVKDWRERLASFPVIHQDKTKRGTEARSPASVNRDIAAVKAALNLALEDRHVTSDAAWKITLKPLKGATNRRDCYLDLEQRRKLIAAAPTDLAALITALSLIPLRPGAVAALTSSNYDKRLNTLTIRKDKAHAGRKFALPPSTAKFFAAQVKDKLPDAPLLARSDGKAWNKDSWKYPFKAAAAAAGMPSGAVMYSLRHSAITDLVNNRLDLMTVAALSGTSVAMIEKHYSHLLKEHATKALATLAL